MASSMFLFVTFVEAALVGINLFLFSYGYPETVQESLWGRRWIEAIQLKPKASDLLLCQPLRASRNSLHLVSKVSDPSIQQDKQSDRALGSPTSILLLRSLPFAYLLHGLAYDLWACSTSGRNAFCNAVSCHFGHFPLPASNRQTTPMINTQVVYRGI
jgi:hypothetical protein